MEASQFQTVTRMDALQDRVPASVELANVQLVVLRVGGEVNVFQGECPHQGTSLATATVDGTTLECPAHGWCFDVHTGERVDRKGKCIRKFKSRVEDGEVQVDACDLGQWVAKANRGSPHRPSGSTAVRTADSLPGPRGLPVLGNLLSMPVAKFHNVIGGWREEYGETFRFAFPGFGTVAAFSKPATVRAVLKDRPETFRRAAGLRETFAELGIDGLFSNEGDDWSRARRLTTPAFNMAHLSSFHGTMSKLLDRLGKRWRTHAAGGARVDVQDEMTRFTVDVTTALAFGHDLNTIEGHGGDIRDHLALFLPRISERILTPVAYWRYLKLPKDRALDRAVVAVRGMVEELVLAARTRMQGCPASEATTFLESLVVGMDEHGNRLTDDELFGNVITMLVAGEDTTAHTLTFAVHMLTEHPEVQERVYEELQRELGGSRAVATRDYGRLVYLQAVASETMRMRSVAPLVFLQATTDVEIEGIAIPSGATVCMLTGHTGRLEENFGEADRFDPERWLPGNERTHRPEAIFPFGHGPRHCPGRSLAMIEIQAALALLVGEFSVKKVPEHPPVGERFGFVVSATPVHVTLTARG